jgi:two-component system chemotaxis response regulator CheB
MRVLICDPDECNASELAAHIRKLHPTARLRHVATLTEAYNITEHRVPDHLLIANALARAPEAELLFALAKLVGVRCARLLSDRSDDATGPLASIQTLPQNPTEQQLTALLTRAAQTAQPGIESSRRVSQGRTFDNNALILIGASTGGIDALIRILQNWTSASPPTMIVQHTGADHIGSLIRLLNGITEATVLSAADGEVLKTGHVYLAMGEGVHLCLRQGRALRAALVPAPPMSGHRPSVDMLFRSALPHATRVSAALLTGMGKDGAAGLLALRQAGATTMVQDAETSVVYGMPRIAKQIGAADHELPIDKIGPALLEASRKRTSAA